MYPESQPRGSRFLRAALPLAVLLALAATPARADDVPAPLHSARQDASSADSGRCPDVLKIPGAATARLLSDRVINGNLADRVGGHLALSSPPQGAATIRRCTGIRLSAEWALTAAHCGITKDWTVLAATLSADMGLPLSIERTIAHPEYKSTTDRRYDAMLLRVMGPAGAVFALPRNPSVPADGAFVRVAGYGTDPATARSAPLDQNATTTPATEDKLDGDDRGGKETDLRHVDIPVVPHDECALAYKGSPNLGTLDSSRQVCAGYLAGVCDACSGDSGGPVSQFAADGTEVAVALVSAAAGCARPGFPGINVRIAPLIPWLEENGAQFTLGDPVQQFAAGNVRPEVTTTTVESVTTAPTVTPSSSPSAAVPLASPSQSRTPPSPSPSPSQSTAPPSKAPRPSSTPTPSPSVSMVPSLSASPMPSLSASPLSSPSASAPVAPSASLSASPSPSILASPSEQAVTPTPSASVTVSLPTVADGNEAAEEGRGVPEATAADADSAAATPSPDEALASPGAGTEDEGGSGGPSESAGGNNATSGEGDAGEPGDPAASTAGTSGDVKTVAGVAGAAALVLVVVGVLSAIRSMRRSPA